MLLTPDMVIAAVNVMLLTTLISTPLLTALESAENVDTSVLAAVGDEVSCDVGAAVVS